MKLLICCALQAIKRANGVQYGLCASLWTENSGRTHRVSQALDVSDCNMLVCDSTLFSCLFSFRSQVGTVWVNCWLVRDLNVPFGGCKMSGVGREGLKDSLEFYTEVKTVCIKH